MKKKIRKVNKHLHITQTHLKRAYKILPSTVEWENKSSKYGKYNYGEDVYADVYVAFEEKGFVHNRIEETKFYTMTCTFTMTLFSRDL